MAITTASFEYWIISASTKLGQLGDEHEITRNIIINKLDGTPFDIVKDVELAITEGIIPVVNQAYPSSGASWQQFARFRSYSMQPMDKGYVSVQLRWTTRYTTNPTSTTTLKYDLPSSTEYQTVARSTQIYRTGWTVAPPAALDTSADVGGNPISGNTGGQAFQVPQTRIRMRFTQDASAVSMLTSATTLSNYVNRRNSLTFLGCAANSLVCEGLNVVKLDGEYYELVFDFLFDPWFHHEQVATVAADGRPTRNGADLAEVKWKRLPLSTTNFNDLYNADADLKTITEKGWWQ